MITQKTLTALIEKGADKFVNPKGRDLPPMSRSLQHVIRDRSECYTAGAQSLAPALLMAVGGLDKYKHLSLEQGISHFSYAAEALAKIEEVLK